MKITETNIDVWVIPKWLNEVFSGEFSHPEGKPAKLQSSQDPDGDFVIPVDVDKTEDWLFLQGAMIQNPETREEKILRDWVTVKKYKYKEEEL